MKLTATLAASTSIAAAMLSTSSQAAITIAQTAAPAPTYANVLNFDEVGGPTGANVPTNSWTAIGISSVVGYDSGMGSVLNLDGIVPGAPNSNVLYSPWGLEITFAQPVSALSFQGWGNGGPPSPIGGGTFITLYNGDYTPGSEVGGGGYNAAWGGVGNEWFNITTTDGSAFDRIIFSANTFGFPEQFIDNLSWTTAPVPAPGAFALLGLAGFVGSRRRRSN